MTQSFTTAAVVLLVLSAAAWAQVRPRVDAPRAEVAIPATANPVLVANGHTVSQILDLVPETRMHRVQSFRSRLYVARTGAADGWVVFDGGVRRGGPRVLDVRADGTVLLSDAQDGLYVWPPGTSPLSGAGEQLRKPGGAPYELLRANSHGVLVKDREDFAYYFVLFKDDKPQVDGRFELLRQAARLSSEQPRVGARWIVWDRRSRDLQTGFAKHRGELVAFDCERKEIKELPLTDCFQVDGLEGDLLLAQHLVTLNGKVGYEIIGFDLAAGKRTAAYNQHEFLRCIDLRDGIGYLVNHTRDPLTNKYLGKVAAVDFRNQSRVLFAHDLPPSDRAQSLKIDARGLIHPEAPATVIPWAVRP